MEGGKDKWHCLAKWQIKKWDGRLETDEICNSLLIFCSFTFDGCPKRWCQSLVWDKLKLLQLIYWNVKEKRAKASWIQNIEIDLSSTLPNYHALSMVPNKTRISKKVNRIFVSFYE